MSGSQVTRMMQERMSRRHLKFYKERLAFIKKQHTETVSRWDDKQLQTEFLGLLEQVQGGTKSLDNVLVEVYAFVIEVIWRTMHIRLHDVQIMASIALHEGKMVEVQTGEGKTLAAVLPAILHAMEGSGVHILTFNDYLARRDAEWMGPIYKWLGMSAGYIQQGMSSADRRQAYAESVTYATAKEAGFDYLKDSLCYDSAEQVHRSLHCVFIDEADSILIDEARIPLVIAGEAVVPGDEVQLRKMADMVRCLSEGSDYDTDEYRRNVYLTEAGIDQVEAMLDCCNVYEEEHAPILTAVHAALHAEALLKRDVDYIVQDGRVHLIDEWTGRIAQQRHWPDGLQAAVEAKEGIRIHGRGRILGTITLQHLLSLYTHLSGMTATAQSSTDQFWDTYCLEVVVIPPHRPCRRLDEPPLVFTHKEAKMKAIVAEVITVHATGRPILIGTESVAYSQLLAEQLRASSIECHVLNAKHDEQEADIIANAGRWGAVTVSTNMAGRGVDIRLGGEREEEYQRVAELGGLYVIGTNLHESIRLDNQLRGRAGRQGDPGSSRLFISLEDELLVRFGMERALPSDMLSLRQDTPLISREVIKTVEHIQRVMQGQHIDIQRMLNQYADMVEQQRRVFFERRTHVLLGYEPLLLLASRVPEKVKAVCEYFGSHKMAYIEKQITLFQMDSAWADYLDYVAYIREGIHLERIGKNNPVDEFHRRMVEAYSKLMSTIEEAIVNRFLGMELSEEGMQLEAAGLKRPSATWTYIINDQFFQNRVSLM